MSNRFCQVHGVGFARLRLCVLRSQGFSEPPLPILSTKSNRQETML